MQNQQATMLISAAMQVKVALDPSAQAVMPMQGVLLDPTV